MLEGHKVRLASIREQDLPIIAKWYENSEFLRLLDAVPAIPKSERSFKKWVENEDDSNDEFHLAIRLKESDGIIGFIEIDGILWNQRNGWLAIAIGDASHQNQGLGTEALTLALNFCFGELNLHRVQLSVFEYNKRAIALYEKLGFQKEGRYREFLKRDGETYDMILYGLLEPEWQKTKG